MHLHAHTPSHPLSNPTLRNEIDTATSPRFASQIVSSSSASLHCLVPCDSSVHCTPPSLDRAASARNIRLATSRVQAAAAESAGGDLVRTRRSSNFVMVEAAESAGSGRVVRYCFKAMARNLGSHLAVLLVYALVTMEIGQDPMAWVSTPEFDVGTASTLEEHGVALRTPPSLLSISLSDLATPRSSVPGHQCEGGQWHHRRGGAVEEDAPPCHISPSHMTRRQLSKQHRTAAAMSIL